MLSYGNYNADLWVILPKVTSKVLETNNITADGYFHELNKWLVGVDYYLVTKYDKNNPQSEEEQLNQLIIELAKRKPPFILALEDSTITALAPQTRQEGVKKALVKWAGSLLSSSLFDWPHYIMGTYSPETVFAQYELKDIVVNLDIGKLKDEINYYKKNKRHQELPNRVLMPCLTVEEALVCMEDSISFRESQYLSVDIETQRPKENSSNFNPGYVIPLTIGLATSTDMAFSFPLWEWDSMETAKIFKILASKFQSCTIIGQNFFNFDLFFLENLGFKFKEIIDIRIRHHILWPELSHKLMFMTRQYTREPYYKDDGKNYIPKNKAAKERLLRYNALDAAVTLEVFNAQEEEFKERPLLR